jgi:chemotaxis protein histidine kinase CheA
MNGQIDFREYLDEFRAEVLEHLAVLDTQLVQLERDPANPAPLRQMFLSAHTIKGSAAMVGLTEISRLAHSIEDVLASLRDHQQPLDTAMADLLFRSLDMLRTLSERSQPDQRMEELPVVELVILLRQRADHGQGEAPAPESVATPIASPPAAPPRVLLVEDSPTVRMLETMLLTDAGFSVEAVGDGARALEMALAQPFDLLVTGVETRGMRGPDLAISLRAAPRGWNLPIIIMSSNNDETARERAAEAQVQAYIRKGSLGQQRLVETARALVMPAPAI